MLHRHHLRVAFKNISSLKCGIYLRAAFNQVNMVFKHVAYMYM